MADEKLKDLLFTVVRHKGIIACPARSLAINWRMRNQFATHGVGIQGLSVLKNSPRMDEPVAWPLARLPILGNLIVPPPRKRRFLVAKVCSEPENGS
jgi:hypothetical protein